MHHCPAVPTKMGEIDQAAAGVAFRSALQLAPLCPKWYS